MPNQQSNTGDASRRGFASMDEDKQREIAAQGGAANGARLQDKSPRKLAKRAVSWTGMATASEENALSQASGPSVGEAVSGTDSA